MLSLPPQTGWAPVVTIPATLASCLVYGFPVDAAVIGIAAATIVGALTGLVPALTAVRVKVIDAIRFEMPDPPVGLGVRC